MQTHTTFPVGNGMAITGSGGWLLNCAGIGVSGGGICGSPFPTSPTFILANGDRGDFYWDDLVIGGMVYYNQTASQVSVLDWNATVVSTAEPSTSMMLTAAGLIGLMARVWRRISR